MQKIDRSIGHQLYRSWLEQAGTCFSPMSKCSEPLVAGRWRSWTIEGLYQGLKLIQIRNISKIDESLAPRVIAQDDNGSVVHFPDILLVASNIKRHRLFHLLKSGKGYNGKRNKHLGRLGPMEPNWAFTDTWLDPDTDRPLSRSEFSTAVLHPATRIHLSHHRKEVDRLRGAWERGEWLIDESMIAAHKHLVYIETLVRSGEI